MWWQSPWWPWLVSRRTSPLVVCWFQGSQGVLKCHQRKMDTTVALPLTTAVFLVSSPLLSLFSQADRPMIFIDLHWISLKNYLKISIEKLGVGAQILLVHSFLWYHVKKKMCAYLHRTNSFLLIEQNVPVPETFFSEELLTIHNYFYTL